MCVGTFLLTGCAGTKVSTFTSPDGSSINKVKCNQDSNKCFVEASKSCNGGSYLVLDSESHAGGLAADYLAGPVTWYSFTYKCGPSDGKMPEFRFQGQQYTPPPVIHNTTTTNYSPPINKMTTTNCNKIGDSINCTSF